MQQNISWCQKVLLAHWQTKVAPIVIIMIMLSLFSQISLASVKQNNTIQEKQISLDKYLNTTKSLNSKNELLRNAARFYQARHFESYWYDGKKLTRKAQEVLKTLNNAHHEGLNPRNYRDALVAVDQANRDPSKITKAEIVLTSYALEYIDDLFGERLNPKRIKKELYIKAKTVDAVSIAQNKSKKDPSWKWFSSLTLKYPAYQMLKKELNATRERLVKSPYPEISNGAKLEKGTKGGRVETLQWQLSALGYLRQIVTQGEIDKVTDQAIRDFQKSNNLKIDGVVGPITIAALNSYNLKRRIQKLIVSMERWRWLPEDLGQRYVFVNIAGFDLKAVENGETRLRMPVIIGRNYRKTPVFSSEIYSIRFNPSWHVPRSIAVKDKLRKIKKDPGYLDRGNFVLYDASGSQINPNSVDWSLVSAKNFNYRLRQKPGAHNALGKIRFSIKTTSNIYLHSTPNKALFNKAKRAFSSGCIRVGNPQDLAEFVFKGMDDWTSKKITANMEGLQTKNVSLKNPVKVYITYFTIWMGDDNKLKYSQDLYGQDAAIWNALQQRTAPRLRLAQF